MAMCKECGEVVASNEVTNGFCRSCLGEGKVSVAKVQTVAVNRENEEITMVDFGNPFSFKGRSGRSDYFFYGILVPLALFGMGMYVSMALGFMPLLLIFALFAMAIGTAALIRRCRDRKENIVLVIILMMVPYFGILVSLYLLLAPSRRMKVEKTVTISPEEIKENKENV